MKLKRHSTLSTLLLAAIAAIAIAPQGQAQTYNGTFNFNNADVLLVLSVNTEDSIYYDLGNVSQFLNQASGYQTQVTGWDPTIAETALGVSSLSGVNFNLGAADASGTYNYDAWATYTADETLTAVGRNKVGDAISANGGDLVTLSEGQSVGSQQPNAADIFGDNYAVLSPNQNVAWDYKNNDNTWEGSPAYLTEGSFAATVSSDTTASIPFYQFAANDTTLEGYFSLESDGDLIFSTDPVAAPEPSTYALGISGLLTLAWRSRFNRKNA